ncbi:MoxR family ATPase, partial [Planctomycetaceae bacterium AH-315-I19]|nr:MoxR family ATPase [Planctomycetaceae bacterium AH-315-I19]
NEHLSKLRENIAGVFLGNDSAIDQLLICLLARGHALIEDVPGVGKTVLATAIAKSIDASFNRLQFTPDMLPADVIGVSILSTESDEFRFRHGPIFANVVLADEINRAAPRTQSALLEAMNEATVSVDGTTHALPSPFMVIATQNPYEFHGTYPLPENQLDRFLMLIALGYPDAETESRVLAMRPARNALADLQAVVRAEEIVALQEQVDEVRIAEPITDYIVSLARATREHPDVRLGLSPRGSLALAAAARANALLDGRDFCTPDDVTAHIHPVVGHRIVMRHQTESHTDGALQAILDELTRSVPSPA